MSSQLLAFARRQPLKPEVVDVNAMIGGMIELLDRTLGERFTIRTDLWGETCLVEADRAQLASAVLNIAVNARDAMPDGGTLKVCTQKVHEPGGAMVAICIADSGTGMDEETLARAMEPFFTTKAAGKGTGLGLRVTRARSGEEALQAAAERPFDAVLSDVVMPGISGLEVAEQLRTLRPNLPVVLTTGYSDEISRSGAGGRPVLLKPYRLDSLAAALDDALAGSVEVRR